MDKQTALDYLKARSTIIENGCWLFNGTIVVGYGMAAIEGKRIYVHRLSAYIHFGLDLDSESLVCHKPIVCKHRNCWNPDHIYIGSYLSNELDKQLDKTNNTAKTHCPEGHPLEGNNLIINKLSGGLQSRSCRQCTNARRRGKRYLAERLKKSGITIGHKQ